jgi:hypothetical protein
MGEIVIKYTHIVDPGYPQGAPLQINCVGVPLVGTRRSTLLLFLNVPSVLIQDVSMDRSQNSQLELTCHRSSLISRERPWR